MRTLTSLLPDRFRRALLIRHLTSGLSAAGLAIRRLVLTDSDKATDTLTVALRKEGGAIVIGLHRTSLTIPFVYRMLYARLPVVLRVFVETGSEVQAAIADLSDGADQQSGALAFCSARDDVVLVPDPVFYNSDGYREYRDPDLARPWSQRSDIVLWRGTATGFGAVTTETMSPDDTNLRQRVRMCLRLRDVPGTDVKIRKIESDASAADRSVLAKHRLVGDKVRQADWGRIKFALDIDGHTNAWSNLYVRLLLGCCVLKIGSERAFRQWYYDELTPWQHYVPVRADMADLADMIAWCHAHDIECARIAEQGRNFAYAREVDREISSAKDRVEAAARRKNAVST